MKRFLRAVVAAAALLILIAVLLGYGGPVVHGLDMLAHFRLHLLYLGMAVAVLGAALAHWTSLWRAVLATVLALAGLAPISEQVRPATDGIRLVVMTANLYQQNPDPDAMLAALHAADPDILVTNETTKTVLTGAPPLTDRFAYRLALSTTGRTLRTVIWSKYPMRSGDLLLEDQIEPTGARALVEIEDGREISILGLHLAHSLTGNQARQIEALAGIMHHLPAPRIVMGDFNAAPWSHAMRRIEALTGTARIPGFRITWKGSYRISAGEVGAPLGHAIDHVLISPAIGVEAVETVAIPGSDHMAVRAVLRLPGA